MSVLTHFSRYQDTVENGTSDLRREKVMQRIWQHDHTVWKQDPAEISNRLGWLNCPHNMTGHLSLIYDFIQEVRAEGFSNALLLGMGGSSLAPEVFRTVFGKSQGYLDLSVLDSTDPDAVESAIKNSDPLKTLFIVSTKSGGTVETMSFMKYCYTEIAKIVGVQNAGKYFVAITDPGSGLESTARELKFRKIFLNDPDIGGRYSALSFFGLLPAALVGIDIELLLERAALNLSESQSRDDNILGTAMGILANAGRDKLILLLSPQVEPFGAWIEQLIAESSGKEGKGILPVIETDKTVHESSAEDRFIVYLKLDQDTTYDDSMNKLLKAGNPGITIHLRDVYELGGEFFRWELATAVAAYHLKINPFDQPNVESAKIQARKLVADFTEKGQLREPHSTLKIDDVTLFSDSVSTSVEELLRKFFENMTGGKYLSIQAYINPDQKTKNVLRQLRVELQKKYGCITTLGFGPRFLHSTGQLHKGDSGNGRFIQILSKNRNDLHIPDQAGSSESSISFGILKLAQAFGDREALILQGRRIITFLIEGDIAKGLEKIVRVLS
jgi:glucose-6-phosphate isomerase